MKALVNPTPAQLEAYRDGICKNLQKENNSLKMRNENLLLEISKLRESIETCRIDWGRVGADKAIQNLIGR